MEPIFQKNLQFRDIWPRNSQKVAQIEVFRHFRDFASLVFLDFAHNDGWALCLVGPVSAHEIGVAGNNWLVGWLVGCLVGWLVTQFSQKRLEGFL